MALGSDDDLPLRFGHASFASGVGGHGAERESGNDCRGAGARGHGGYAERESVRPAVRPSVWPADVID